MLCYLGSVFTHLWFSLLCLLHAARVKRLACPISVCVSMLYDVCIMTQLFNYALLRTSPYQAIHTPVPMKTHASKCSATEWQPHLQSPVGIGHLPMGGASTHIHWAATHTTDLPLYWWCWCSCFYFYEDFQDFPFQSVKNFPSLKLCSICLYCLISLSRLNYMSPRRLGALGCVCVFMSSLCP